MERKGKKVRHTTGRQEGGCLPAKKEVGGKQAFKDLGLRLPAVRTLNTWLLWKPGPVSVGYQVYSRWVFGGLCEARLLYPLLKRMG